MNLIILISYIEFWTKSMFMSTPLMTLNKNPSFQVELESSKKQTGERFGAAIAAVDLDGDGIDELVIGAPLYSSKVSMK